MSTAVIERRSTTATVELRGDAGSRKIGGLAIVYGRYSQNLGGYVEQVEPGFVTKSLADRVDVLARYQHDSNFLLGRVSAETLRLMDGADGLDYEADLPDTTYARDLEALAARGDVRHSSFAFRVMPEGDSWGFTDQGTPLRTLKRGGGQLVDVAPVVTPAYLDTTSGLRSLAEQRGLDLDDVRKAAEANALGELLRSGAPVVIDLAPKGSAASGAQGPTHAPLSVYQRRLDLLAKARTS